MREFLLAASSTGGDMSEYFELFNSDYTLGKAAIVALIGIVVVFTILLVLVGLLTVFEKIFSAIGKRSKKTVKEFSEQQPSAEDEETVAAIIAAITMMYAEERGEDSVPPFKVRRIRQVNNTKR